MPMLVHGPVLVLSADVVKQLEGEEALPLLWTLFTKSKQSLKDGRRLENISWRLWHRSLSSSSTFSRPDPLPEILAAEEDRLLSEKSYRPPTPEDIIPQPTPVTCTTTSNHLSSTQGLSDPVISFPLPQLNGNKMSLSSSPSRKLSSRRNSQTRSSTHVSVGKVLCELIPAATIPSFTSLTPVPNAAPTLSSLAFSPTQPVDPRTLPSTSLPLSSPLLHLTANLPVMTLSIKAEVPPSASLPTPEAEHPERVYPLLLPVAPTNSNVNDSLAILPVITTDDSSPHENHSQPVSDNHDLPPARPPPPRLVVVNPTPNPTPHPTPPATPVLHPHVASHMKSTGEATSTLTVPHLRVPGHDPAVQAQGRPRTTSIGSKLRLFTHDPEDEDQEPTFSNDTEPNPAEATPRLEVLAPSAIPAPASDVSECALNSNRHSISSDTTTTSSSSRLSFSSTTSHYSQTTSITTISEYPLVEKRCFSSPAPLVLTADDEEEEDCLISSGLSPTSPQLDESSTSILNRASKRQEKDIGVIVTSKPPTEALGKTLKIGLSSLSLAARSTSTTSKGPVIDSDRSLSLNKGSLPVTTSTMTTTTTTRSVNHHHPPARKSSSGGVSTSGRSRIMREGSMTMTTTNKGNSRSQSRTREGSGTTLVVKRANSRKGIGKVNRGRAVGGGVGGGGGGGGGGGMMGRTGGVMRRTTLPSRKSSVNEGVEETNNKRSIVFNIGSGSDAGSKSTGAGSEMDMKEVGNVIGPSSLSTTSQVVEETHGDKGLKDISPVISPVVLVEEKIQPSRRNQPKVKEKEGAVVTFVDKEKEKEKEKERAKGKGKEKAKSPKPSPLPKYVQETIADPLLPSKIRQVVLTSDSEEEEDDFETETESWTGTESADVPVSASQQRLQQQLERQLEQQKVLQLEQQQEQHRQVQFLQQLQQRQQQQQQQPQQQEHRHQPQQQQQQQHHQPQHPRPNQPPPLMRTQSHYIPRNSKPAARAQQRAADHRAAEERKWKDEMFVKLPKSSFENLTKVARTRSAGLLSQLLNPELQGLPSDHPYRRGFSSGMIQPLRPFTPLAPIPQHSPQVATSQLQPQQGQQQQQRSVPSQPLASSATQVPPPPPPAAAAVTAPATTAGAGAGAADPAKDAESKLPPHQHNRQASRIYQLPKRLAVVGAMAKTPVATAVMSELRVGSVNGTKQVTTGGISVVNSSGGGKYKPKGRPPETVMESDSEETDDNQLDLSKSVAQEKLKALLEGNKLKKSTQVAQQQDQIGGVGENGVVGRQQLWQPQQQQHIPSQSAEPISIPPPRLHYPYNLPPPNPPTTPRTTRRKMLAVEIPESLRRNLLWERQVSQAHARGLKRSASSNDAVKGWEIPNVVKLTPKNMKPDAKDKKAESRRRYLARTRSWLFEYHVTGW